MKVPVIYSSLLLLVVIASEVNLTVQPFNVNQQHRFYNPMFRRRFGPGWPDLGRERRPDRRPEVRHPQAHSHIQRLKQNTNLHPRKPQPLRITNGIESLPRWVVERFPQGRQQRQYGFCDRQYGMNTMLSEIKKLFPGRFMSEEALRQTDLERRRRRLHIHRDEQWEFNPATKIRDLSILSESEALRLGDNTIEIQRPRSEASTIIESTVQRNAQSQLQQTNHNPQSNRPQTSGQDRSQLPPFRCEPTCCETEMLHVFYENITIAGQNYSVINLPNEKQFMNVGFCPDRNTCTFGKCFQHYTTQFVVIWNVTVEYWPPVDVTPHDFPSHCSWIG